MRVFVTENIGICKVNDQIWLASFSGYDLGFFDKKSDREEPTVHAGQTPF